MAYLAVDSQKSKVELFLGQSGVLLRSIFFSSNLVDWQQVLSIYINQIFANYHLKSNKLLIASYLLNNCFISHVIFSFTTNIWSICSPYHKDALLRTNNHDIFICRLSKIFIECHIFNAAISSITLDFNTIKHIQLMRCICDELFDVAIY